MIVFPLKDKYQEVTKNKAESEHHMREALGKSSRFEYQLKND